LGLIGPPALGQALGQRVVERGDLGRVAHRARLLQERRQLRLGLVGVAREALMLGL
jgi:hypothetical protein